MKKLFALLMLFGLGMFTIGCDKPEAPAENATEAVEEVTETVEENGDNVEATVEETVEDAN